VALLASRSSLIAEKISALMAGEADGQPGTTPIVRGTSA
jgi:hypothetical protein